MEDKRVTRESEHISKTNKCKDCKWAKKNDRWTLYCKHEKWSKVDFWGGTSPLMGNSTCACKCFQKK